MEKKTIAITGGIGPERLEYAKDYIENVINDNSLIIIYDATYSLVSYSHHENVSYYCVDSVLPYLEKLKVIKERSIKKTYIVTDAYAGLMHSKENNEMFENILKNKQALNIEVLMLARHESFIPNNFLKYFDKVIHLDEINTVLANNAK